uniref:3-phosphoinositide-dependent protein kinase 1 n=1 Tax=Plectus sambesii TaxID=2011161 RepID=A0A914VUR2_9BILA
MLKYFVLALTLTVPANAFLGLDAVVDPVADFFGFGKETNSIKPAVPKPIEPANKSGKSNCPIVHHSSSYFQNKVPEVHEEFVPALERIIKYAEESDVKLYITSSFRKNTDVHGAIVPPAVKSNHLVGRAIDMNIVYKGGFCNSDCLAGHLTGDVAKFIEKIRADHGLRWGGDFTPRDTVHIDDGLNIQDPAKWDSDAERTSAVPRTIELLTSTCDGRAASRIGGVRRRAKTRQSVCARQCVRVARCCYYAAPNAADSNISRGRREFDLPPPDAQQQPICCRVMTAAAAVGGDPPLIREEDDDDDDDVVAATTISPLQQPAAINDRRFTYTNPDDVTMGGDSKNATNSSSTTASTSSSEAGGTAASSSSPDTDAVRRKPTDFFFLRSIGEGSFSTVYLAKERTTDRKFAIKVCEKARIRKENKVHLIHREKEVMARLSKQDSHPCFVRLYCTFQDSERLFFAMTYAERGEMLDFLRKLGSFDDEVTQFYAAELVSALDYLHRLGVVHRDLKPENVLLGGNMHILISDFGSSKILGQQDGPSASHPMKLAESRPTKERSSFVGTAQYVSPEVLNGKPVGPSCDYWALGAIIYQMLAGLPPFRAANEYLVFQKIINSNYTFPQGFPAVAKDLVEKLIVQNSAQRLGSDEMGGVAVLKEHPFFAGVNWVTLHTQEPPALKPYLPASGDEPAFHSDYHVPEDLEPGLNEAAMTRLLGLQLSGFDTVKVELTGENDSKEERRRRLEDQRKNNPYHRFVDDNLILKSGLVDKKKGLFARRRMFLLTEGPHLYYVDPTNMELKGEVPWSRQMRPEAKNFRTFFVHTPNRTYYLFDPSRNAIEWCEAIEKVREMYFCHEDEAPKDIVVPTNNRRGASKR